MMTLRLAYGPLSLNVQLSLVMGMHARCIRCNARLHSEALALAGPALSREHAFRDGWISIPDIAVNSIAFVGAQSTLRELQLERERAETRLDRPALYVMQSLVDHELTCAERANGYRDDEGQVR